MFGIFKTRKDKKIEELEKSRKALLESNKSLKDDKRRISLELQKTVNEMSDQILTSNSIIEAQSKKNNNLKELEKKLRGELEIAKCKIKSLTKKVKSCNGKIGGLASSNSKLARKYALALEELNTVKAELKHEKEEKNSLVEIAKKQNEEIRELKNKPKPPTKEELERDLLFHGKRNKRKQKQNI